MRITVFAFLTLFALSATADDRTAKIKALMDAQGLVEMWDQQMQLGKQQGRQQALQMLDQMLTSLVPTPELNARFRQAFDTFMEALEPPWTAREIVDVWAGKYGSRFSDQELDSLVAYYTSPLGKKDVAATQAAMPEFMAHFTELAKPIMEKATQTYVESLQKAVRDCNCKKQ
jgi:hypothetical protein